MKVFVAGATGVLGRGLVPQLVARGHEVVGMTRRLGSTFVSGYILERAEEPFYTSIGFTQNEAHLVYIIDQRPYVRRNPPSRGEAG